jgi:hypothetical protein
MDSTVAIADTAAVGADSAAAADRIRLPVFGYSRFDSIPKVEYLLRHAYSLDHYMEQEPGFVLGRFGPIGKSTLQSRYAFGRGRASVRLNDIPVNDPQNGVAPLYSMPVSGLDLLLKGGGAAAGGTGADGIEGELRLAEEPPPPLEPTTFLEASKSTQRNLRQRRVWFASMTGKIGLDFGYDEILNDGYSFDAGQLDSPDFVSGQGYGESHTRYLTLNFRGQLPGNDSYKFSLRRFVADSNGDLESIDSEQSLSGHVASVSATLGGTVRLNLFSRGYDYITRPGYAADADSNTVNLTTAAYVDWTPAGNERRAVTVGGGYESIRWVQEVGGGSDSDLLRKWALRMSAVTAAGDNWQAHLQANTTIYQRLFAQWGATAAVSREAGRHHISVYAARQYRMPNLGELYLPAHSAGEGGRLTVSGNPDVESEYAWEAGGRFTSQLGPLTNELRVMGLRVYRPIGFLDAEVEGAAWRMATNGDREQAGIIEDRVSLDTVVKGFELIARGSLARSGSDRESFFVSVPLWEAHGSFRFGRSVFQTTSALYVGLDYTYRSSRGTVEGPRMPSYHLLNLKLDGRLLGANMYLSMINVLDSQYQTVRGYLMTPRTIVYGLYWRILD